MTHTIPETPVKEVIDNSQVLADSGLTIVHVNNNFGGDRTFRALTIAYEQINKSHLKIATAVTHRADTFTKKKGTQVALKNFAAGNTIVVPLDRNQNVAVQLRRMFGYVQ